MKLFLEDGCQKPKLDKYNSIVCIFLCDVRTEIYPIGMVLIQKFTKDSCLMKFSRHFL